MTSFEDILNYMKEIVVNNVKSVKSTDSVTIEKVAERMLDSGGETDYVASYGSRGKTVEFTTRLIDFTHMEFESEFGKDVLELE
jgi:hypothetical protein